METGQECPFSLGLRQSGAVRSCDTPRVGRLSHCVSVGVEELDQGKLSPLLKLKYHNSLNDAVADLGSDIGEAFTGFQKFLYEHVAKVGRGA